MAVNYVGFPTCNKSSTCYLFMPPYLNFQVNPNLWSSCASTVVSTITSRMKAVSGYALSRALLLYILTFISCEALSLNEGWLKTFYGWPDSQNWFFGPLDCYGLKVANVSPIFLHTWASMSFPIVSDHFHQFQLRRRDVHFLLQKANQSKCRQT